MIHCPTCGGPINADPLDVQPVEEPDEDREARLFGCLLMVASGLLMAGLVLGVVRLLMGYGGG